MKVCVSLPTPEQNGRAYNTVVLMELFYITTVSAIILETVIPCLSLMECYIAITVQSYNRESKQEI